jgi:Tfp pilus assembly protein PilF
MNNQPVILILLLCVSHTFLAAQDKETINSDGVTNQITKTKTGMYGGTESKEADKHFQLASRANQQRDYVAAKKSYLKAIKADPNFVEAYDNLGRVYRELGDYDKAIEYYKKSIKLYPEGDMAHQNLAVVYGIQKNYTGAIEEYEAIIKNNPENPEGYFGVANSQMMLSQFDEALVNAEKAVDLYKKTASSHIGDGHHLVGLIHYYNGDKEKAKMNLLRAKKNGAKVHPQIDKELFSNSEASTKKPENTDFKLETPEDYAKYEDDVVNSFNYLMTSPVNKDVVMRRDLSAFLLRWVTGSPNVSIEISADVVTYLDCEECLLIFMGGWTKYAIESEDYGNKLMGNLKGTESVIEFYKSNKRTLGHNNEIEKLIKLSNSKKLKAWIESRI